MYQSISYASQTGKTVFVEMAERSAETARLLRAPGTAEVTRRAMQARFLARRPATQVGELLRGLRKRTTQVRAPARS